MANYRDYTYLIMPQPQRLSHWSLCRTPPASPDFKRSPSVPGPLRPVPHRRVGDTMVAAAASAAAPQAIFTWVDAQQIPANDRVSRRLAHAWLADLREMLGHKGLSEYNLSTGALRGALWRGYLANHHLARQIIGDGIYRFEVRALDAWDANMKSNRVDFVARRVDGTDVRLHPGMIKDKVLIFGQLADWLPDERAAQLPPAPAMSRGLLYRDSHGRAGGDNVSRAQIKGWLNERVEAWEASVFVSFANPRLHSYLLNLSPPLCACFTLGSRSLASINQSYITMA